MTLEELMQLYKPAPGYYFKIVSPNKTNFYMYAVEIWQERNIKKPVAVGCAIRLDNAFVDAMDNFKQNV